MTIGKEGISAKVIAHSITEQGVELITYELDYARFFHSEFMTHRVLSKNAASSRAIPVKSMMKLIDENPAMPIYWGKNEPGMVANEELETIKISGAKALWVATSKIVLACVQVLSDMGLHKQIANRLLEPWSRIKVVVTGTEWDNFFYLRDHPDAQPEIRELARVMLVAKSESEPITLKPGQWHLPYVTTLVGENGEIRYFNIVDGAIVKYTLEEAQKISTSCCAQVSYRKSDDSLEKAERVYSMLNIGSTTKPQHASPTEHLATPMRQHEANGYMNIPYLPDSWQSGITHITRGGDFYSGNLHGYIQYRQLVT